MAHASVVLPRVGFAISVVALESSAATLDSPNILANIATGSDTLSESFYRHVMSLIGFAHSRRHADDEPALAGIPEANDGFSQIDAIIESASFPGVPEAYLAAGRLHLVYEYLYASKLLMRKADHSEFDANAVAKISQVGNAEVKARVEQERRSCSQHRSRCDRATALIA